MQSIHLGNPESVDPRCCSMHGCSWPRLTLDLCAPRPVRTSTVACCCWWCSAWLGMPTLPKQDRTPIRMIPAAMMLPPIAATALRLASMKGMSTAAGVVAASA